MDTLYPNLHERFKSEGVCPVCLMEMELAARYTCSNGHTICYRCKPYYYACPSCQSPLEMERPSSHPGPPYPTHFMPHPLPPKFQQYQPTAPNPNDFIHHERTPFPPTPTSDQILISCSYADLGCWVKVPEHLLDLHESRCQFRPHLEEECLPTDVAHKHDDLVECKYRVVGCNVRTSPWRIVIHEAHCEYKERFETLHDINDTINEIRITDEDGYGEELVECKYRKYGCMVNMPRRRKAVHQQKCNYQKYHTGEDDSSSSEGEYDPEALVECKYRRYGCMVNMPRRRKLIHQEKCNYRQYHTEEEDSPSECDPNEQVACRWAEYGCKVRPKRFRVENHEEKCNYKMEECAFKDNGCSELFHPSRKFVHERSCPFAN